MSSSSSSSSSSRRQREGKGQRKEGKAAALAAAKVGTEKKKKTTTTTTTNPPRRMTQEQIDALIQYPTVHMPEEFFLEMKEKRRQKQLEIKGDLPVPLGPHDYLAKLDHFLANICRDINRTEERFRQQRDRMLNDYYTKGYAVEEDEEEEEEEEEASPPTPPSISKQAGKQKKDGLI